MSHPAPAAETDTSTRQRILVATAEVLGRNGKTKLSLSEVATQAGVSRPTLYRWFASKEELLSAFSRYERQVFESGLVRATAGLRGTDKLDAVLRFIVDYQHSYLGRAHGRCRTRARHRPSVPRHPARCATDCNGTCPDPMPR